MNPHPFSLSRHRPVRYDDGLWRSVDHLVVFLFTRSPFVPTDVVIRHILFVHGATPRILAQCKRTASIEAFCVRASVSSPWCDLFERCPIAQHEYRSLLGPAFVAASLLQLTQHPRMHRVVVKWNGDAASSVELRIIKTVRKLSRMWGRERARREALIALALVEHILEQGFDGVSAATYDR